MILGYVESGILVIVAISCRARFQSNHLTALCKGSHRPTLFGWQFLADNRVSRRNLNAQAMRDLGSLVRPLYYVEGNSLQIVANPSPSYYRHSSCNSYNLHHHHDLASATFSSLCSACHVSNICQNPDIHTRTLIVTAFRIPDENRSTVHRAPLSAKTSPQPYRNVMPAQAKIMKGYLYYPSYL